MVKPVEKTGDEIAFGLCNSEGCLRDDGARIVCQDELRTADNCVSRHHMYGLHPERAT